MRLRVAYSLDGDPPTGPTQMMNMVVFSHPTVQGGNFLCFHCEFLALLQFYTKQPELHPANTVKHL